MNESNLKNNGTMLDAVDTVISHIGNQLESQFWTLKEHRTQYDRATRVANDAKKEVGLLDKINIFSKSDSERQRDDLKEKATEINRKLKKAEFEIRETILNNIPSELMTSCLIGDLRIALNSAIALNQKSESECRRVENELNRMERTQESSLGYNSSSIRDLKESIAQSNETSVSAKKVLLKLAQHHEDTTGIPIAIISRQELVDSTFENLKNKFF